MGVFISSVPSVPSVVENGVALIPLILVSEFKCKGLGWEIGWELYCYGAVLHTGEERFFCGEESHFSHWKICSP